ncbi:MAG: putative sulfate exporter family transporter [Firmicutes bacterium]|nr:putative sulfate exporter family transporter [Bacillota bacterium]
MLILVLVYVLCAMLITLPIVTPGYYSKQNICGALLCLVIAVVAWFLGQHLPVIGGAIIAIFLGMLLANFWHCPKIFIPGISATSKRVLQAAIVLFGFQMNLGNVLNIGGQGLILIGVSISVAFVLAFIIGKVLRIQTNEQLLIGVGTAICGGSAIAAIAPIIKANEREVATSISIIFLFNILAVFIFPIVGYAFGMSDLRFGLWCGSAINDTSSVVAAAFTYSETAGNTATVVKLTRTLMIIPLALILSFKQTKKEGRLSKRHIIKAFPWFVAAFFLASIISSLNILPMQISKFWGSMGRFCILMALAGIGLNVNILELIKHGKKPIILGGCCWIAVAIISFFMQALLGFV